MNHTGPLKNGCSDPVANGYPNKQNSTALLKYLKVSAVRGQTLTGVDTEEILITGKASEEK